MFHCKYVYLQPSSLCYSKMRNGQVTQTASKNVLNLSCILKQNVFMLITSANSIELGPFLISLLFKARPFFCKNLALFYRDVFVGISLLFVGEHESKSIKIIVVLCIQVQLTSCSLSTSKIVFSSNS